MESTDDIDLFVDTIIVDMNLGYENSNIAVRAKVHCIEHAMIDDQESSSDTLHVFNKYKPSYEEIRSVIELSLTASFHSLQRNHFHIENKIKEGVGAKEVK